MNHIAAKGNILTVACVLKSGGIYDATWVARLKVGVKRHLSVEHRFVCLSDVDVPCERVPLEHDWPGWWSKIELYRLYGPVLFYDLDTALVGDQSDLARQATQCELTLLRDFYRLGDGVGTGVMAWNGDRSDLYETFASDPVGWQTKIGGRGDQGFVEEAINLRAASRWQDVAPGQVVSYKAHCRGRSEVTGLPTCNGIPPNARVVCLHGHPKFADMPATDPVRLAWEQAA